MNRTYERKKNTVYNNASELYNEYLEIYFSQYTTLSDAKKGKLDDNYDPENLFLKDMIIVCGQRRKNQMLKKNL